MVDYVCWACACVAARKGRTATLQSVRLPPCEAPWVHMESHLWLCSHFLQLSASTRVMAPTDCPWGSVTWCLFLRSARGGTGVTCIMTPHKRWGVASQPKTFSSNQQPSSLLTVSVDVPLVVHQSTLMVKLPDEVQCQQSHYSTARCLVENRYYSNPISCLLV